MKNETVSFQEQIATANEKSRQLERQLYDKERELKRMINELNEAHKSNRQLQVRIDELREEMSIYMPATPGGNAACDLGELDNIDANFALIQENHDVQKSSFFNDMSPELTLRCYKSLLNTVTNCHQHIFELKQEMWEMYHQIQITNSTLRSFIKKRSVFIESDEEEEEKSDEPHSPHPINLSSALTDLSNLVSKVTCSKEHRKNSHDETIDKLTKKLETLVRERDAAVTARNFLNMSLENARLDVKSANSQLVKTIQQKISLQKEIEAWQEDMECMVQRSLAGKDGMRRINSLYHPRKAQQRPDLNPLSVYSLNPEINCDASDPSMDINPLPASAFSRLSNSTTNLSSQAGKSGNFFTAWLRRKWNQSSDQSSSGT